MPTGRRIRGEDVQVEESASGRERLQQAAERLFARDGVHRAKLREINALAGTKNPSALHYHFGSREALVNVILQTHQRAMDEELAPALDELEARTTLPSVREIVATTVRPLAAELDTQSGRDFVRILPQVLEVVSANLRMGAPPPASEQPARSLALLERHLDHLPPELRAERLVTYVLLITSLMAERAHHVETAPSPALSPERFVEHAIDVLSAVIEAPTSTGSGKRRR